MTRSLQPNMAMGIGVPITLSTAIFLACRSNQPPLSLAAVSLLVFNNVNILISICEVILGFKIDFIKADYTKMKAKALEKGSDYTEYTACYEFLFGLAAPSWLALFTTARPWARMWSVYALLDPSYQNNDSFGFFVDVGNGVSTIPACFMWNLALAGLLPTSTSAHAQVCLCALGLMSYWQMMYGTLVYWLSYVYHKRYNLRSPMTAISIVAAANGVWVAFPAIGISLAVRMLCVLADGNADAVNVVFCGGAGK